MLKLLLYSVAGKFGESYRIAKGFQPPVTIEVVHNRAVNAIARINVVAPAICCRNGDVFGVLAEVVPQAIIRDAFLQVRVMGGYPGEVVKAPVHQIAHICPPVIGMHNHTDQVMMIARHRHHLNKIRLSIIACLSTVYPWIPPEELVFIEQETLGMIAALRYMIGLLPAYLMQRWQAHTVPSQ